MADVVTFGGQEAAAPRGSNKSREAALSANVRNMPSGAPFLPTLSRALLGGELIPGFPGDDPFDLARATIYVPTRRAAQALSRELVRQSGKPVLILPRIAPLGAFEPTLGDDAGEPDPAQPLAERPAVGELARRMALSQLTRKWGDELKGAIRSVSRDGDLIVDDAEPPLVIGGPAQAFALAGDLAALIDDMIIEDVAPGRLSKLVADEFDLYWGVTLNFLKIAFEAWPRWLDEKRLVDRARQTALLVDREIASLADPTRGPVIIAGSTGANRATARLIAAIARARDGAVVLPNLDMHLDDAAFALVGRENDEAAGPVAGHPQTLLKRLLDTIGIPRADVRDLAEPPRALGFRARALSDALRPAETTETWPQRRDELGVEAIEEGLAGVSLVVADTESEEALALAVAMREALETPGRRAALITPDAGLARRVAAELARWGIEVENSAGRTLAQTPAGEFARLALAAARDLSAQAIAALIERPQTSVSREDFKRGARALQLTALRSSLAPLTFDAVDEVMAEARRVARDPRAHPRVARLDATDLAAAESLLTALVTALAPLREHKAASVGAFIEAHRTALDALAAPQMWDETPDGAAVAEALEEWRLASEDGFDVTLADYVALFAAVVATRRAPAPTGAHPRLAILGLLEARLLDFDLALIAGLDEGVWPPAPDTDAFLNRAMRAELGLSPPERRIGQTAHDFLDALGAPQAILSRAKKRGGAPTVESRFLQRLEAFAGDKIKQAMEKRGARYLALARRLDRPEKTPAAGRPEPRPPAALRPKKLSVTRIEALRRDPYAVYAERILRLQKLPAIGEQAGPSEIGTMWHDALQVFAQSSPHDEDFAARRARLDAELERVFAPLMRKPSFRALYWPRIAQAANAFLEFDAERRDARESAAFEVDGALEIPFGDDQTFTLTARADRIELTPDGGAVVIDYKTGTPPGNSEITVGFAPQLTLEAAMLERGAFKGVTAAKAEMLVHFKLGGAHGGEAKVYAPPKETTLADVVDAHFAGLKTLVTEFADPNTPYIPRPFPKFLGRGSDYDHLARVAEWAVGERDET